MELANLLAEHGNKQELLSELLLLQNEAGDDSATEKKTAQLFLSAGSAPRAAEIYRKLAREAPDDSQVNEDLGLAEVLLGNYRAARNAFWRALELHSDSASIRTELAVVAKLSDLDPTSRRLSSAEKFRRSVEILDMTRDSLNSCLSNRHVPDNLKPLLESADRLKSEKIKGQPSNETSEARLDLAEKLWASRGEVCSEAPRPEDPLPVLMKKLAQ